MEFKGQLGLNKAKNVEAGFEVAYVPNSNIGMKVTGRFNAVDYTSEFKWDAEEFEIEIGSTGSVIQHAEFEIHFLQDGFGLEIGKRNF